MRIAAQRSTISSSAAAPQISSKPTGASFLEVLTGTSAQPSSGNATSVSNFTEQRDSEAGHQSRNPSSAAQSQAQSKTDATLSTTTQIAPKSNAAPVIAPQPQVRSNAAGTSRATESPAKTAADSVTPIASSPVLAEVLPVAVPPVPSPIPSAQNDNNAAAQKDDTTGGVADVQSDDNSTARTAHATSNTQNAPETQNPTTVAESSETALNSATQSGNLSSGSTLSAAGFSLPAGITPIALPLSIATLSSADFLPGAGDTGQPTVNAAQSNKSGATSLPKPATVTAAASGVNQTASSATPAAASAHGASNNAQSNPATQHAQSQVVQVTPATQTQVNSSTPQMQPISVHSAAPDVVASHGRADVAAETTHASEQPVQAEASESAGTSGINTANVIQTMSETEMHVGMHSAEFGDISIRTSVSQQQMTAQISVDHGDLGKAITAHIPAMEARLGGEFGIRALVQVSQSGMSFSGERGNSPQREQGSQAEPAQVDSIPVFAESDSAGPRLAAVASDGYRLDIRA